MVEENEIPVEAASDRYAILHKIHPETNSQPGSDERVVRGPSAPGKHIYRRFQHVYRSRVAPHVLHARAVRKNVTENTTRSVKKVGREVLRERKKQHKYPYANPKAAKTRSKYHIPGSGPPNSNPNHNTLNRPYWENYNPEFANRLMGSSDTNVPIDLLVNENNPDKKKIRLI